MPKVTSLIAVSRGLTTNHNETLVPVARRAITYNHNETLVPAGT
jgi:hypothetical protein